MDLLRAGKPPSLRSIRADCGPTALHFDYFLLINCGGGASKGVCSMQSQHHHHLSQVTQQVSLDEKEEASPLCELLVCKAGPAIKPST